MRQSKRNLLVSALHTNLDPEAWILIYVDEGTATSLTNIVTTDLEKKKLAIAMLEAMLTTFNDDTNAPGQMTRLDPSTN